eukprot:g5962.t1
MASITKNSAEEASERKGSNGSDDRAGYYNDWEKKAKKLADEAARQDEIEKEIEDVKLGLKDAPKSEKEAKDKAKFKALKEAKKQWEGRKQIEENLKFEVPEKENVHLDITAKLTGGLPVIIFKGCRGSKYVMPSVLKGTHSPLIKVIVDDCENCSFVVACPLMVGVDISHCENCSFEFPLGGPAAIKTVQVDLCNTVSLKYGKNVMEQGCKVFHAGVEGLTVEACGVDKTTTSYKGLCQPEYVEDGTPEEEVQYITQVSKSRLLTEKCVRVGQQPTTQRELDEDRKNKSDVPIPQPTTKLKQAQMDKLGGNEAFSEGNYSQAMIFYTKAIDAVRIMPVEPKPDLLHICYSNRAACWLRLGQPEKALEDAKSCTKLKPEYVKGLFRTGLALHALGKYEAAGPFFVKALKLQPKNKQIKDALKFAELKMRQQYAKRMRGD